MLFKANVIMQGNLFQRCTHLLYCSALSLGGNVNTRRMPQPDMESIFHIKKSMKYPGHWNYVNYQNYQSSMLLTSSGTKRTLMHYSCLQVPPRKKTGFNMYAEYTQL